MSKKYNKEAGNCLNCLHEHHNAKFKMIVLPNTSTDPWAMMVKFTNTFSTTKAMLCSHFLSAFTNIAVIVAIIARITLLLNKSFTLFLYSLQIHILVLYLIPRIIARADDKESVYRQQNPIQQNVDIILIK